MGAGAALAAIDEVDKLLRQHAGESFARLGDGVLHQVAPHEQRPVGLLQLEPFLTGKTGALEADAVEAAHAVDAANDGERRQVEAHAGAALHHRHRADPAELVHDSVAREERAVANDRVAADECAVGEDRPVADDRVVADVAVCHEHVFRADPRVLLERVGAVNGDVFAKGVAVADDQAGWFTVVFHVLRCVADDAAGVETVAAADRCVAGEVRVRPDHAVGSERDGFVDDGVRADLGAVVNLRVFVDDGGGMNHS